MAGISAMISRPRRRDRRTFAGEAQPVPWSAAVGILGGVSVVFILGAGASAQAGVPMMRQFLDRAHDLWRAGRVGNAKDSFDLVFDAVGVLPQVHSKAMLDVDNVESVFSAFEMAGVIGVFGNYSDERIRQLDAAMRLVIAETIEQSMSLPTQGGRAMPPPPYYEFASLLNRMRTGYPRYDTTVITFNYDLALDYAFQFVSLPISYGFGADDPSDGMPLLKLHGSLNWALCRQCNEVVPWRLQKYLQNRSWHDLDQVKSVRLALTSQLHSFMHHDAPVDPVPVIVPPTWGKTSQHVNLSRVWNRAARALQAAENIFVIGYSLPPSDAFFKYLYALGTVGPTRIRRFWVFDPAPDVAERYKDMLGQAVQTKFQHIHSLFKESIDSIGRALPSEA
jgi:hypothetical protein